MSELETKKLRDSEDKTHLPIPAGTEGKEPAPWPMGVRISKEKKLECAVPDDLAVVLSQEAFHQLFGYAYATASEICCLGTVKQEGPVFKIEKFYLVDQKGSCAHTELDQAAVGLLVEKLLSEGRAEEARSMKVWAHSHPGMDVFWSHTDDETCRNLVTDYLVSLVVSNDFAIRARIDLVGPVPFTIDNVPVLYETPVDQAALEEYAEEVKEKLKREPSLFLVGKHEEVEGQRVLFEDYCEACGNWHEEGKCPVVNGEFSQKEWDEYVRECRARGIDPDTGDLEFPSFGEFAYF